MLLDQALALWRGPALAGLAPEEVRVCLCHGLDEERLTAHEYLIGARVRLGRHDGLLAELLTLTGEHPHRPRLIAALTRTLHRAGRTAEALETYRRARQRFRDDSGLNPPPDLRELQLAILHDDSAIMVINRKPRHRRFPCQTGAFAVPWSPMWMPW